MFSFSFKNVVAFGHNEQKLHGHRNKILGKQLVILVVALRQRLGLSATSPMVGF